MEQKPKIAFFGTPAIAVWVLQELVEAHIVPALIVTNPDRSSGRGLQLHASPVKLWALENGIEVFQPESLEHKEALGRLVSVEWDLFIVFAYGAIMPKWLIELPKHGTLNMHPSLLPKLRGASPIRTSILQNLEDAGVTIMLMDEKMDHGPILAQEPFTSSTPVKGAELDSILAHKGGKLLAQVIPQWLRGDITPREQNHAEATYAKKFLTEDAQLFIDPLHLPEGEEAYQVLLKIYAFEGNPGSYFIHNNKRIKVLDAHIADNKLAITRVVPEGKKEMDFAQYCASL